MSRLLSIAVALCAAVAYAAVADTSAQAPLDWRSLTPPGVERLEQSLATHPGDVAASDVSVHAALAHYYFAYAPGRMSGADIAAARRRHILWLIAHAPGAVVLGEPAGVLTEATGAELAAQLWRQQAADANAAAAALINAAYFFRTRNPLLATSYLDRALDREPGNERAAAARGAEDAIELLGVTAIDRGGNIDSFDASSQRMQAGVELVASHNAVRLAGAAAFLAGQPDIYVTPNRFGDRDLVEFTRELLARADALAPGNRRVAAAAMKFYDTLDATQRTAAKHVATLSEARGFAVTDGQRLSIESRLASAQFDTGDLAAAAGTAQAALAVARRVADAGDARNAAYTVLGRIALRHGDAASARDYLLRSAAVHATPALESFGPDLSLAQDLLERGERAAVLSYLRRCALFWSMGETRITTWIDLLERGETPNLALQYGTAPEAFVGKPAQPFRLLGLDGKTYSLDGLRGRVLVLDFWATWCPPCREELRDLDVLAREYGDSSVAIFAVNAGEERSRVEKFVVNGGYKLRVLLGGNETLIGAYGVTAYPATIVIDESGRVADYHAGRMDESQLRAAIERALKPSVAK